VEIILDKISSNTLIYLVFLLSFCMSGCGHRPFTKAYQVSMGSPPITTSPSPPASTSGDASFLPMLKAGVDASTSKGATRLSVLNAVTSAAYKSEAGSNKAQTAAESINPNKLAADEKPCPCSTKEAGGDKAPPYKVDENNGWLPTNCQAFIVQAAVNHCIEKVRGAGILANVRDEVIPFFSSIIKVADIFTSNIPTTVITGVAGLITTTSANLKNPTQPTNKSMYESAASYAQFNQNMPLTAQQDRDNYYAGLWNAAGLTCPSNFLQQEFKMEEIPYNGKDKPAG